MLAVMVCWAVSVASGLMWRPWVTGVLTAALAGVWVLVRPSGGHGIPAAGWWVRWESLAELGLLAGGPWLLAAQQARDRRAMKRLHAEEAAEVGQLSSTVRSLLSLQAATQQVEAHMAQIIDVYHVTKETVRALRLPELFSGSIEITPRLLNASGLRLIDCSGPAPRALRARRLADGRMVQSAAGGSSASGSETVNLLGVEQAMMRRVTASGQTATASVEELVGSAEGGAAKFAWTTLWREQRPIGVLIADDLPSQQLKTLAMVADQLSLQLSRIHLYQQVEALAVTDALTGLFVRGYFTERAVEELARSKRYSLACTLLMVDLDSFKEKNDTFGHLVGDVVLRDVARLLQRNLREVDLIARFGGEEFVLLLIETQPEQAWPIAERLRQLVEVHSIRAYDELLTQTISIGLAGFPAHGEALEELMEHADQALYAAKRAGRNRVIQWSERLLAA